jgi:hypothetical protein
LSLYLSLTATSTGAEAQRAFDFFRTLYSVRSNIVHGASHRAKVQKSIDDLKTDFDELLKYAKLSMLYYCSFLNQSEPEKWSSHCLDLAIGNAPKLI